MSTHAAASPLLKVLSFALLPALAMLIGGVAATFRAPNAVWRSAILHFAAGVVFSVVAVELLPDIVKQHRPLEVALGFGGGVAAMLGVRALASRLEGEEKPAVTSPLDGVATRALPVGLLFGVAVDLAVDGLLLGIGFAAGQKEGVLLALALTVEILALGLATATQLGHDGVARGKTIGIIGALGGLFFVSACGGATLLHGLKGEMLELVLSFGLAALLFLVTEELLVEAHEAAETPLLTASFFGGFLLFLLLGMST